MNVIYGLNEAGKSTLQAAVSALLYGFYDADRVKADERSRHERFRPWAQGSAAGAPFRGSLRYGLECGEMFEVRRDFASSDVPTQLIDMAFGRDVAPEFGLGRHGNIPFARRQLGMSRGVFQSCAFIAQGEIYEASQGASPREIGDAIAGMADSARRDVSAAGALSRLDGLMLRIGKDRARTAELPKARESLRVAEAELSALEASRAALAEKSSELEVRMSRLDVLGNQIVAAQAQYLAVREKSISRRLASVREEDSRLERSLLGKEKLARFAEFPAHLRDEVLMLDDRRKRATSRVEDHLRIVDERRAACEEDYRLEYEALRVSVGELSPESLRKLSEIAYVTPHREPSRGVIARFAGWLRDVIVGTFRRVLRRSAPVAVADERSEIGQTVVSREDAVVLLDRHRRYLTLWPLVEALERAQAQLAQEESALRTVGLELGSLLGLSDGDDIGAAVAAFLDACTKRAAYESAVSEASGAEGRRDALLGGRPPEYVATQLEECRSRLDALLKDHPDLEPGETSATASEIEERLAQLGVEKRELDLAVARLDEEVRVTLGDQRSRAEIEEDVARWRRDVQRLERMRRSAEIAREVIDEAMTAVYRDFAPAVSGFLSDGFAHITEGRYRRAHVDPSTLAVSLLVPETDQVITDPPLSRGTMSLAYILMRIGLAQHMSSVAEPVPLVLDDPFVDLDATRLGRTLEFVASLSERMQVLIFTKDPGILRWIEENAATSGNRVLMLTGAKEPAAAL